MVMVEGGALRLRGEVDLDTAPQLISELTSYAGQTSGTVVVDCRELSFIDSSGIDALLRVRGALRAEDRRLRLVNVQPSPRRVMQILGLTEALGVAESD